MSLTRSAEGCNSYDEVEQDKAYPANNPDDDSDHAELLGLFRRILRAGDIARSYFAVHLSGEDDRRDGQRSTTKDRNDPLHHVVRNSCGCAGWRGRSPVLRHFLLS